MVGGASRGRRRRDVVVEKSVAFVRSCSLVAAQWVDDMIAVAGRPSVSAFAGST